MDKDKLKQTLDLLIEKLAEKGLLPGVTPQEKETLKNSMADTLLAEDSYNLRKENFLNKNVQKTLMCALVSFFTMQKHPEFGLQFNIRQLFNKETSDNDLKNIFKSTLTLLNKKPGLKKPLTERQIEEALEEIMKKITEKSDKKDIPAQSETIANILEILMSETLRSLYGGQDPRGTGGEAFPLQSIVGNLIAALILAQSLSLRGN